MKLKELLLKAMGPEWALAYRRKRNGEILYSEQQPFSLIKNTLRYWCADPFLAEEETNTYLFFEAYDRWKRKGAIGYRKITGNHAGTLHIVIEEPFHLSYPYIYKDNGSWYLIPESKDSRQIVRYRAEKFPDRWEKEKILADNIPAVDTTVLSCGPDGLLLFTYLFERFNKGELQLLHITGDKLSIQYRYDDLEGRKRPAGKICRIGSFRYRPSQLCTRAYGEAVIFNKIREFVGGSYEEEERKTIGADEIRLDRNNRITGVHTYNNSENWEVIDVKIEELSILRILGLVPGLYHAIKKRYRKRRQKY